MSDFWNSNPSDPNSQNPGNSGQNPGSPNPGEQPAGSGSDAGQQTPPAQNQSPTPHYYTPSQPYGGDNQGSQWNYSQYTAPGPSQKPPRRNKGLIVFTVLVCSVLLVAVLCMAGIGVYSLVKNNNPQSSQSGAAASSGADQGSSAAPEASPEIKDKPSDASANSAASADGALTTVEVAKRVTPVVVNVIEYGSYQGQMYSGSGSGIISSADGYIVTNAHVVTMPDGTAANGLEVVLSDGTRKEAHLVGADTRTDLAVIKIDASNLAYAEFGNSNEMQIGETVIAIGNPGGEELASSVSQGIISGLNRQVKTSTEGYSINCIQTDAAINPGNSGGPLVNQYGQVIGINSVKLVDTEYEGIGFAIPINDAKPIVDQLIAHGKVTDRARLGITGVAVTYNYSQYYSLPQGILVISTEQGSDISTKGLRTGEVAGDIITAVDGNAITSFDDVAKALNGKKAGDQVQLTVYRQAYQGEKSSTFTITVKLVADSN